MKYFSIAAATVGLAAFVALLAHSPSVASTSASPRSALMSSAEIASLPAGFACEWHCETTSDQCYQEQECCAFSGVTECTQQAQREICSTSECGVFDACDKTCLGDPAASCGNEQVYQCLSAECKKFGMVVGTFGGSKVPVATGDSCGQVNQCRTGSI